MEKLVEIRLLLFQSCDIAWFGFAQSCSTVGAGVVRTYCVKRTANNFSSGSRVVYFPEKMQLLEIAKINFEHAKRSLSVLMRSCIPYVKSCLRAKIEHDLNDKDHRLRL